MKNDNYCIILEDKIYSQRTPNSKFTEFDLKGVKQRTYEELPTEIKDIININEDIQKNPKKYFKYFINNDFIIIEKINNIDIPYIKIPDYIEGLPVGLLEANLCVDIRDTIQQIQIPETVKQFSPFSFANCKKLNHINMPEKLWFIPEHCFENCFQLKDVNLENIKEIYASAFASCCSLKKLNLENVESLSDFSFINCSGLENVTIGQKIKAISEGCFMNCHRLKTLNLSDTLETICKHAFQGCNQLKNFIAPKNLKKIYQMAFYQNDLDIIILNDNLDLVEQRAFTSILANNTKVTVGTNTKYFNNSFSKGSIIETNKQEKCDIER